MTKEEFERLKREQKESGKSIKTFLADKVNELQRLGEFSVTNYAIVNLFLFVAFFLIVFFGNIIYLAFCNKKNWLRGISYIYWIPLVCVLLIGWGGHF